MSTKKAVYACSECGNEHVVESPDRVTMAIEHECECGNDFFKLTNKDDHSIKAPQTIRRSGTRRNKPFMRQKLGQMKNFYKTDVFDPEGL